YYFLFAWHAAAGESGRKRLSISWDPAFFRRCACLSTMLVSPPCLSLHSSELPAIIRLYRWRLLFSRVVCWRLCCISCWQGIRDKLGLGRRVFNKKALGFIPAPFK